MTDPDHEIAAAESQVRPETKEIMLLSFLRDHDAECPNCGYNLRALTKPICPECGGELVLTVGMKRIRLAWLLAAVAPGFFSGIAAVFLAIPILGRIFFGDGQVSWVLVGLDLFGFSSGLAAILLATKRTRYLALTRARQRDWAIFIWVVHVLALFWFILLVAGYM